MSSSLKQDAEENLRKKIWKVKKVKKEGKKKKWNDKDNLLLVYVEIVQFSRKIFYQKNSLRVICVFISLLKTEGHPENENRDFLKFFNF